MQNFLWRESPQEPLKCLELLTFTYGTNFAPYIATQVLQDIALKDTSHPLAKEALLNQTNVDDILSGCESEKNLHDLYSQLKSLHLRI